MRVVHMDSGLGNQMLDYAEYMAISQENPDEKCYLENMIYELPQKEGMFSIWNGYELERIFGINPPNVKQLFDEDAWQRILKRVEKSEFWKEDWNYAPYITQALQEEGLALTNLRKGPRINDKQNQNIKWQARELLTRFFQTRLGYHIKRYLRKALAPKLIADANRAYDVFRKYPSDVYIGHSFAFKYKGFGIEKIDGKIREAFRFPQIQDEKNQKMLEMIHSCNAVSIHARRSDLLFLNGYCYKYGFFRRSVKYIKKHVKDPVFIFFTDENSVGWCEENEKVFGLNFKKDTVYFVDWNKGEESFRDMQLMAECKHNIFTESTFGFWGAYLNQNPDKITCAPDPLILATHTF
ncbi:alpha-1,2-fucosyltransferase [Eisenbergiella sp.]